MTLRSAERLFPSCYLWNASSGTLLRVLSEHPCGACVLNWGGTCEFHIHHCSHGLGEHGRSSTEVGRSLRRCPSRCAAAWGRAGMRVARVSTLGPNGRSERRGPVNLFGTICRDLPQKGFPRLLRSWPTAASKVRLAAAFCRGSGVSKSAGRACIAPACRHRLLWDGFR